MTISTLATDYSELHVIQDPQTELQAVICLHQPNQKIAIGGCRMMAYPSINAAIDDAVRLSRAMLYKAVINDLPYAGGKAVIVLPKKGNRKLLLARFADLINSLAGKFITTIDSGTSADDMALIHQTSSYVLGYQPEETALISQSTAVGVYNSMLAAIEHTCPQADLAGLHIAIQGVGHVGYQLAKILHARGAQLTVADINAELTAICATKFNAKVVAPEEIFAVRCDIFSPCALGQVINSETVNIIRAKMIIGSANEQLAAPGLAEKLHQRGILYLPDFVINAGGLIHVSQLVQQSSLTTIHTQVKLIHERVRQLLQEAAISHSSPLTVANAKVKRILAGSG